jgi:phosphohistidine phosphatase
MILYFLRHGLAGDRAAWEGDDRERPLTKKGIQHMEATARTLKKLGVEVDAILSSPLKRAIQTAQIVAETLGLQVIQDERLAYGFGLEALGQLIREHAQAKALLLVGHEPDFSLTISALTGGSDLSIQKGGLVRVELTGESQDKGQLVWLLPPKILILG